MASAFREKDPPRCLSRQNSSTWSFRAGLRRDELARRKHDVFLKRPKTHRNEAWGGDHVEAPVEVNVEGRLVKPCVTWFIDGNNNAVTGTARWPARPRSLTPVQRAIAGRPSIGRVIDSLGSIMRSSATEITTHRFHTETEARSGRTYVRGQVGRAVVIAAPGSLDVEPGGGR